MLYIFIYYNDYGERLYVDFVLLSYGNLIGSLVKLF